MFVLTKFRHSVRLDPSEWKRALPEVRDNSKVDTYMHATLCVAFELYLFQYMVSSFILTPFGI